MLASETGYSNLGKELENWGSERKNSKGGSDQECLGDELSLHQSFDASLSGFPSYRRLQAAAWTRARRRSRPLFPGDIPIGPSASGTPSWAGPLRSIWAWRWGAANNPRGLRTCLSPSRSPRISLAQSFERLLGSHLERPIRPTHQYLFAGGSLTAL